MRFTGFLKAIGNMNIDSIQNYTYPKLFSIIPRDQSRQSMETSYTFFKGKAELDSIKIDTIKPVFHVGKGSYSIAIYSMVIKIPLDSTEKNIAKPAIDTGIKHSIGDRYPSPQSTLMATLMRSESGIEITRLDEADGIRTIKVKVLAVAAKDEFAKEWSFFTVTEDQELVNKLFPRKVLEKLASYNQQ